jgi:predicted nuclease of predicted toxin-antitoxin system
MNLFADECVYKVTVDLLRSWGHDVLTAQEVGLSGKPDEEILAYAVRHERVLITIDMDFSNIRHYTPESHRGIIVAKIRRATQMQFIRSYSIY